MARGMKIALMLSLIFNVFAIGVFAGQYFADGQRESAAVPRSIGNPMRMMRYARELPPESKEKFREVLRADIPELREKRDELRALQRVYDNALQAKTWNRAAVETALHDVQTARAEIRTLIDKTFIDAVETLSHEDRALLRETERKRRGNRERRRDDRG